MGHQEDDDPLVGIAPLHSPKRLREGGSFGLPGILTRSCTERICGPEVYPPAPNAGPGG